MKKIFWKVFVVLEISFISLPLFSQVVKNPAKMFSWGKDDSNFAYIQGDSVSLLDSKTLVRFDSFPVKNIEKILLSTEGESQVLLAITDSGVFSAYQIYSDNEGGKKIADKSGNLKFSEKPYFSVNCARGGAIKNVQFSKNSEFIAISLQDKSINLFYKFYKTTNNEPILRNLVGHKSDVFSLNFSRNSKYLISTSSDGTAIVWDCDKILKTSDLAVFSIKNLYTKSKIPAVFLNSFFVSENKSSETESGIVASENKFVASENKSVSSGGANNSLRIPAVVACDGKKSFAVYNSSGEKEFSVSTENEIRMIKPLNSCAGFSGDFRRNSGQSSVRDSGNNSGNDLGKIAVLDGIGRLLIYDLNTKSLVGYIPVGTSLTDFEFNNDDSHILLGYENGSVYNISFKAGLLKPGEEPENIGDGSGFYGGSLGGSGGSSFGGGFSGFGGVGKNGGSFSSREGFYIDISGGIKSATSPYMMSAELMFSVLNYDFLKPFYIGLSIVPGLGFPKSDYPYVYRLNGENLDSPFFVGAKILIPLGFFIMPFSDSDFGISAEIFAGTSACLLWNRKFTSQAITSKLFPAFVVGTKLGVSWKFISVYIGAEWDSVQKISILAGLGATFRIGREKQ